MSIKQASRDSLQAIEADSKKDWETATELYSIAIESYRDVLKNTPNVLKRKLIQSRIDRLENRQDEIDRYLTFKKAKKLNPDKYDSDDEDAQEPLPNEGIDENADKELMEDLEDIGDSEHGEEIPPEKKQLKKEAIDFVSPAIRAAKEGAGLDSKKKHNEALIKYKEAIELFTVAIKYEKNPQTKQMLREKTLEILERAELLQSSIDSSKKTTDFDQGEYFAKEATAFDKKGLYKEALSNYMKSIHFFMKERKTLINEIDALLLKEKIEKLMKRAEAIKLLISEKTEKNRKTNEDDFQFFMKKGEIFLKEAESSKELKTKYNNYMDAIKFFTLASGHTNEVQRRSINTKVNFLVIKAEVLRRQLDQIQ